MPVKVILCDEQEKELREYISAIMRDEIKKAAEYEQQRRPVLKLKDAAQWVGVSAPTLKRWEALGLKVSYINDKPYYLKDDILKFINEKKL